MISRTTPEKDMPVKKRYRISRAAEYRPKDQQPNPPLRMMERRMNNTWNAFRDTGFPRYCVGRPKEGAMAGVRSRTARKRKVRKRIEKTIFLSEIRCIK